MTPILVSFLSLVTAVWVLTLPPDSAAGALPWALRQEALYLTGLWAFSFMSLAILLATRPAWLERPLGGMDRVYRLHRWAGILAIGAAALHWLVEMSDDLIKAFFGREGRLPKEHEGGFLEVMRDLAEELGEWAIYALLAMLVLALWKRFPYRLWRPIHHVMPVLYAMLAIHAAFLAPLAYWTSTAGALLALLIGSGMFAAVRSLSGRVGRTRQVNGVIEVVRQPVPDITEVVCRLDAGWRGHQPGQFAFATFDRIEGAHPFTIASANRGDRRISFQIKALGDYTRGLGARLQPGQPVRVEGPYGCFDFRRARKGGQIWIAGGIGVTPFLAWLESLQSSPQDAPDTDFYYCTRHRDKDPFVPRLEVLCASLPTIRLHIRSSDRDSQLTAQALHGRHGDAPTEIWFCGPRPFADTLRNGLRKLGAHMRFHQEAFELR
ncbi:ferredoxin reductase family protein [Aromatoleum diolicum]|uniref:Ferric reductase n=1 Tax=Aromatoleum diolicum TaxID=75796 RepID=A0ABX1QCW3_9RHOO|nr:ferric reductase-like transmembrane domain-containing protein [Aromatoleum diolicum]NMG75271.1 ferric reductase [Aromatoleum diolicum]